MKTKELKKRSNGVHPKTNGILPLTNILKTNGNTNHTSERERK